MRLIDDWSVIATKAHSMWAVYFGLIFWALPEIIFGLWGIDTNPVIWWSLAGASLAWGVFGRLVNQTERGQLRGPWKTLIAILILAALLFTWKGDWRDFLPDRAPEAAQAATVAPLVAQAAPETVTPDEPEAPKPGLQPDGSFMALAIETIGKWEGLRLTAYRDIVGVWTVCYGETKGVKPGDSYTRAECDAMLAREIARYRAGLHKYFTDATIRTRLPDPRDVAFTSLAYNVGVAGAGRSTATKRLNAGNVTGACEALTWWNKAGGRVVRGLVRRRADEHRLCMVGVG